MTKSTIVSQLKEYFESKGKILTLEEYKTAEDAPIRYQILKRKLGTWTRIQNMVSTYKSVETTTTTVVEEVTPTVVKEPVKQAPAAKPAAKKE